MPIGIYIRTALHRENASKITLKNWENPTLAMINSAFNVGKLPRTNKQLATTHKNLKKGWKSKKGSKNFIAYNKSDKGRKFHRENMSQVGKTSISDRLECHHRNGNHRDDNQFNLVALRHGTHMKVRRNKIWYTKEIAEIKLISEMYYGD